MWGSEISSRKKKWGSEKIPGRIWGREIVFREKMGACNIFWEIYGGDFFFKDYGGAKLFPVCFFENSHRGIKKDYLLNRLNRLLAPDVMQTKKTNKNLYQKIK